MAQRSLFLGALLLVLASAPAVHAQSNTGTTLGTFLKIETSGRSAAMGNAGVALTGGIESVYFNPAVIGSLHRVTAQFSHLFWFAEIELDYAALAIPIQGWGTFFGSVTALNSGDIDVRTVNDPLGTGERYSVSNVSVSVGFGRQLSDRFALGGQLNFINERIWNSSHHAATFSVGTVYRLTDGGIRLGSGLSNLSTRSQFAGRDLAIQFDGNPGANGDNSSLPADQFTGEFAVPLLFRIGLEVPYQVTAKTRVTFLIDALHPNDNSESLNVGGEWSLGRVLSLRGGYQAMFQDDSELGWTFGFGLRRDRRDTDMRIDYAWAGHETLAATHLISVALAF